MALDSSRLSNAKRSIAALRQAAGPERNGRDDQSVRDLEGLSHRASFLYTLTGYTLDANHYPRSFGPASVDGVSDLPTRTLQPVPANFEVRLSAPLPHTTPMVPYAPSAAHVSRFKAALGAESMAITAHLNPSASTGPFHVHGARQRGASQSLALRAASKGELGGPVHEFAELSSTQMQHPLKPAGQGQGETVAGTWGRKLGAAYTDADVELFRPHYDAVGRYFAERIRAVPVSEQPWQEDAEVNAPPQPTQAAAGPPPANSAAAHWARTPLRHFTPRTIELVTSLTAFRTGLQELEAHRRRRNDELNRDPSDWARVTAARSLPPGWDAPFAA